MRLSIALLTIVTSATASTQALACRLTDRLFGRTPYVVGYAPVATGPYTVGYAPAVVTTTPAPSTSVLRPALTPAPVVSNGAYQAQRPTYYDNPSVYTGQPVARTQSYRAPLTPLRGSTPASSYMGTNNAYAATPTYSSNYAAAQVSTTSPGLPLQVTTPTGTPATAIPATPVAPVFAPAQPQVGGLGRFFGSLYGTNYRSSYYRAPITYYRPVTSVDPVSGTTVTGSAPLHLTGSDAAADAVQQPTSRSSRPGDTKSTGLCIRSRLPNHARAEQLCALRASRSRTAGKRHRTSWWLRFAPAIDGAHSLDRSPSSAEQQPLFATRFPVQRVTVDRRASDFDSADASGFTAAPAPCSPVLCSPVLCSPVHCSLVRRHQAPRRPWAGHFNPCRVAHCSRRRQAPAPPAVTGHPSTSHN